MIKLENKYDYFFNVPGYINRKKVYYLFETKLQGMNYTGEVITFTHDNIKHTGKVVSQFNKGNETHFKIEGVDKIPEEMKECKDLTIKD